MKKSSLILFFIISFLFNVNCVLASSSYTCTKEVALGDFIECKITVSSDPVMIVSDGNINIDNLYGNRYSKLSSTKAIFYESGNVTFGPANDKYSKYIISLYDETGSKNYASDIRVSVVSKTTTTTTTTTKKKSSNNYLANIKINGKSIENFSKTTNRYYVSYDYEIKKVMFDVTLEDETATYNINGPDDLEVGDNEYTIGVTSEDNTTRYYKILITRKEKVTELSSNTRLSSIKIKNYNFDFNKTSKTFYLTIDKDEKKLSISVKTEDDNADYEITGNENLINGSEIKIHVTAENGETDTYRIIINKKNNNYCIPCIALGVLILIIAILILLIVKKKKRKNKVKKNNSNDSNNKKTFDKTIEFNIKDNNDINSSNNTVVFNKDEEDKLNKE